MKRLVSLLAASALSCLTAWSGEPSPERARVEAWVRAALLGEAARAAPAPPGLEVRRQDHGEFQFRQSVLKTPLQIGQKKYQHGLGTHSVSEIVVRLPQPAKRFEAEAGIDNNYDTKAEKGSVVFAVEAGGKEVFRSDVWRGSDGPLPVRVDLNGASEFTLRVGDAGDGPGWDQSDWAEAFVMLENGDKVWLDEMKLTGKAAGLSTAVPFSFVYGGKASAELLPTWKRSQARLPAKNGCEAHAVTWTDPATGLEVTAEVTLFDQFPAVEAMLRFRNTGRADTPILEKVLPLDLHVKVPDKGEVILHHAHGSTCTATDFLPVDQPVAPKAAIDLAPSGGRSSNGRLPFFNLEWPGGGIVGAIGWSGQWALRLHRDEAGGVLIQGGQQTTHLKLHPGESIRTPRILLLLWQGDDRFAGHNLFRRLLMAHYLPRVSGELVTPPVTQNTWFTFGTGNDVTEANQLDSIRRMAPLGVEVYWLDAGWFEGGWPSGVGSWVPRADAFPRGLKPLSDAAHKLGMKFIVWFEPERVHPASRIGREHPAFVLRRDGGDGLFNLGNPEARKWLTDWLSKCITEGGIDIYRNDFNIDPLPFWQAADAPDRKGMAEIRYVEGHLEMWDELIRRHPGLWIDTCASGGRRIDLETLTRSVPLWRSDTQCCGKPMPIWDQVQMAGLSLYVPFHTGGVWAFDPYHWRSIATTGVNLCPDARAKDFPTELAKAAIAEAKSLRPFYQGDYYPLLPITLDDSHWIAWQLHRPDLDAGFAVFFRRPQSPYTAAEVALRGLDPKATYELTFFPGYEPKGKKRSTGAELAQFTAEVPSAPASLLIRYQRAAR
ncbi:MAG TPA: alpha-galactosidase [Planctomycetota bacterium]|nr:alpha-galactosidase [Planctomycetota bacterium]